MKNAPAVASGERREGATGKSLPESAARSQAHEGDDMTNDDGVPGWLKRNLAREELRRLGLPWVPEALWRRPADRWLTMADTLEAVALTITLVRSMQRRGIACDLELRTAAQRCVVAGLARLPRDRWPTRQRPAPDADDHRRDDHADEPAVEQADEPVHDPVPLVIRRRGGGGPHAA